jgi:hypothetical protein
LRKAVEATKYAAFAKAGQGQLMQLEPTFVGGEAARDVNAEQNTDLSSASLYRLVGRGKRHGVFRRKDGECPPR